MMKEKTRLPGMSSHNIGQPDYSHVTAFVGAFMQSRISRLKESLLQVTVRQPDRSVLHNRSLYIDQDSCQSLSEALERIAVGFRIPPSEGPNFDHNDISTTMIRTEYLLWSTDKQIKLRNLCLELSEASETHLQLNANGVKVQILIPSTYQLTKVEGATTVSDEVFLVMSSGQVDPKLESSLLALNEKLERITVRSDALSEVLDMLLLTLTRFWDSESKRQQMDMEGGQKTNPVTYKLPTEALLPADYDNMRGFESGDEDDTVAGDDSEEEADDYGFDADTSGYDIAMGGETMQVSSSEIECRSRGFLHALAEDARKVCEIAHKYEIGSVVDLQAKEMMWCSVTSNPAHLKVQLQFELAGAIDDRVAAALGLSLDEPVALQIEFNKTIWLSPFFQGRKSFPFESITATQSKKSDLLSPEGQTQTPPDAVDNYLDAEAAKSGEIEHKSYGLGILFPELTRKFFEALSDPQDLLCLEELDKCVKQANPFLGLATFISLKLMSLPNWCVICWKTLPYSVTGVRTCNQDLCLFRFEELGLGASVLQEIKHSVELVELELSLAQAAVNSQRDVFEPFPAFLLANVEIRGRSGWFSNLQKNNIQNKKISLLKEVLTCIPDTGVLQQCSDEFNLKKVLTKAWYECVHRIQRVPPHAGLADNGQIENWTRERQLAYDVMRFVLTTNRLSLRLLDRKDHVIWSDTIYQFVVLHDTPEKEASFERSRARAGGSFFAFHGSAAENWYSILRNGLRSMSTTSYMSSGASYGEGIYFGERLSTSMGYARSSSGGWTTGALRNGFICLAICEIVNGCTRNHINGILVVPREHEQDVAIRYLLVFPPQTHIEKDLHIQGQILSVRTNLFEHYRGLRLMFKEQQNMQKLVQMSARCELLRSMAAETQRNVVPEVTDVVTLCAQKTKEPEQEVQPRKKRGKVEEKGASSMVTRAVMKELNNLLKMISKAPILKSLIEKGQDIPLLSGVTVNIPDEGQICLWRVSLNHHLFKQSALLYKDLIDLKRQKKTQDINVELEVKFPASYPFEPPFVRVVSPRFIMHTGHITVGGSICMELLTSSGWSPACSFESLLVQVVMAFVEGEGRVDKANSLHGREYQEHEAREAFLRAARAHGWKTS